MSKRVTAVQVADIATCIVKLPYYTTLNEQDYGKIGRVPRPPRDKRFCMRVNTANTPLKGPVLRCRIVYLWDCGGSGLIRGQA